MEIDLRGTGALDLMMLFPAIICFVVFGGVGIMMLVKGFKSLKASLWGVRTVDAKCVEIIETQRGAEGIGGLYCPVYEYEYEGRYMRASSNEYHPYLQEQVGDYRQIMVDKKHPDVLVKTKPSPISGIILLFMGFSFAGSGISAGISFLLPGILMHFAG